MGLQKKLVFVRSIQTPFGGAEVFLKRLTDQLSQDQIEFKILHSSAPKWLASWLKAWWFNFEARFKKSKTDFYFSLDRIDSADIYRAGDGVHQAYLKTKSFSLNPLHLTYLRLEKTCFRNSKHIVCNAPKTKREILEHYPEISPDKISVIPNGIKLPDMSLELKKQARSKLNQELGLEPSQPIILTVGTGFKRKGVKNFLNLISQLKTPVYGLVVGKDKNIKPYQALAKNLGIDDRIIFTGQRQDIEDFYLAADIFIFAPEYEPFGNVVLEAMAYGCVAFTNQACGMVDFLPETYWLDDQTAIKIDQLLTDLDLLITAQLELRAIAAEYSIERTAQMTLELIRKLL